METKKLPLLQRIAAQAPFVDEDHPACLVELRYSPSWKENAWDGDPEAEANVEFICEAFETAKASGMTPAQMWDHLQYVEGLMGKFERQEISFAKKCDDILTRISQMPLGKRIDEGLDDAVLRILNERNLLLDAGKEVLTYEGDTEWAELERSTGHNTALRHLRYMVEGCKPVEIHPPLDCDRETLVAYLKGLQEGERVVEAGQSCMTGRKGTVYFSRHQDSGDVCVRWDVLPGEEGQMGTSATGGTRRLRDAGALPDTQDLQVARVACEAGLKLIKNNWIEEHGNPEVGKAWGALELFLTGKIE
jgi:hypothetical protein